MSKSTLQSSYSSWSARVVKYEQSGIPASVWAPIAQNDMHKTYTADSTPMTNAEADIAVYSAWKGQSAVQESPRHSGGIMGDIKTVASNIIPDVGNIITSLPRGIGELGKELVTPSTYSNTGNDIGAALAAFSAGQYGQGARDVAKSPLLDLIPGVADVSNLTTAAGRTSLMEHPITAALDVLPITKPLSAATGAVAGIDAGAEGAAGALRAGKPLSAAVQGIDQSVLGGRGAALTSKLLNKAQLDLKNRMLSSELNREKLVGQDAHRKVTDSDKETIFKELGNDPEKMIAFSKKLATGDVLGMDATERTVYDKLGAARIKMEDRYTSAGDQVRMEEGMYPKTSPVVKAHNLRDRVGAKYDKATVDLTKAENRLQVAKSRQAVSVAAAQKVLTGMHATGAKVTAATREQTLRSVARSNTEVMRAQRAIATASRKVKDSSKLVKEADKSLQKAVIRDPPAHLHEAIKQNYRRRVAASYSSKTFPDGIPTEGAASSRILSEYNKVMKDISVTPIMDKFYDYVGKDEAKALFSDSVQEALKLDKEGLGPLYFHSLRDADMEKINSLHLARDKDMPEAQVKKRAFDITSSVMNVRAGYGRESLNIIQRDGMKNVYEKAIKPHEKPLRELMDNIYLPAAQKMIDAGKRRGVSVGDLSKTLLHKEWAEFDFDNYGIKRGTGALKSDSVWIPKSMADNLTQFQEGNRADQLLSNRAYQTTMKVFRTSVLYGPRHFAHVVIGGIMPLLLDDPMAITEFPKMWQMFKQLTLGKTFDATGMPGRPEDWATLSSHFDYKTDAGYKMLQTKVGNKYAEMLKDYWAKTGARPGKGIAQIEDAAQSMYQGSVYLRDIKKGVNPVQALEHARKLVVNLDSMSPFERTIMKQVFPFYSFTRFATKFLVQLPFDHPLRVSMLSQLSNQAQEEWGTGLPQTMMSLFFIGEPNAKGDITTVNLRNMNPFRSISNSFTLAGFMSSLNPLLQAPFVAAGFNTLGGTSQLYPEIVYDAQTGGLVAARPKGDLMTAAEGFVPELGALDAYFGISDNLRSLKTTDQGAFDRELMNMFNLPFAISQYNMPQTRGRIAENAYKGAQNALTAYKKSGDFAGTIGRYNLIPYNGQMISPAQFRDYWEKEKAQYGPQNPGADVAALIPKTTAPTTNTFAELQSYYGGQQ